MFVPRYTLMGEVVSCRITYHPPASSVPMLLPGYAFYIVFEFLHP